MDSSSEEIQRLRIAAEEQRILNADMASQIRSLEAKLKMKDDYIKSLNVNETREFNDVVSREGNQMTRMNQKAAHLERMIMIWLTHPMLTLA